jgi:hypothetical protein
MGGMGVLLLQKYLTKPDLAEQNQGTAQSDWQLQAAL